MLIQPPPPFPPPSWRNRFQAPEIIEPNRFAREDRAGFHSDVYALGVTIFLLFCGLERPYHYGYQALEINDKVRTKFVFCLPLVGA